MGVYATVYRIVWLGALALVFTGCGSDDKESKPNSMQFSLYMVGSDLESGESAGTSDLNEIIDGYSSLSSEQKELLDINVAFGGANKDGWRGVKYATIECLIEDGKNSIYGDDSCYAYEKADANMGDVSTLTHFLKYTKNIGQFDKEMIVLWDHGAAYEGIGFDENYDDKLTLNELTSGFSVYSYDVIGMDACLMANYSVALSIKNSAEYFLASEELEPSHGWNYVDVIKAIGENRVKNVAQISVGIIDSFVDSPSHADTEGKTLSLIDLQQIDIVNSYFDRLSSSIDYSRDIKEITRAFTSTKSYGGKDAQKIAGYSHDFISLMDNYTKFLGSDYEDYATSTKVALQNAVIYNRHQQGMENSNGITLIDPFVEYKTIELYDGITSLTSQWRNSINSIKETRLADTVPPTISNAYNCGDGLCVDASDNTAILALMYRIYLRSDDDSSKYELVGSSIEHELIDDDTYEVEKSDGKIAFFCEDSSNCHPLPLTFEKTAKGEDGEVDIYKILLTINDDEAEMRLYFKSDNNELVEVGFNTIVEGLYGNTQDLESGDVIEYSTLLYDINGESLDESEDYGPFTISDSSEFAIKKSDKTLFLNFAVADINYNKNRNKIFAAE